MGVRFTSSKNTVSHVTLENSSDCTIDLAANDSKIYGDSADLRRGANNKVILDGNDNAWMGGTNVKGEGTAAQKDY